MYVKVSTPVIYIYMSGEKDFTQKKVRKDRSCLHMVIYDYSIVRLRHQDHKILWSSDMVRCIIHVDQNMYRKC